MLAVVVAKLAMTGLISQNATHLHEVEDVKSEQQQTGKTEALGAVRR